MKKNDSDINGTAFLKISELAIGNLMVLLAGCLGYLTGFLSGIIREPEGQLRGDDKDRAHHNHGKLRSLPTSHWHCQFGNDLCVSTGFTSGPVKPTK